MQSHFIYARWWFIKACWKMVFIQMMLMILITWQLQQLTLLVNSKFFQDEL